MISPSKQKILVIGSGGIPRNPYPAFETINLSLNHSATSFAIFAPLVLPQPNVLLVSKKLPPRKTGGFDLGLTRPEDIPKSSNLMATNQGMEGAGSADVTSSTENLFSYPIKVS